MAASRTRRLWMSLIVLLILLGALEIGLRLAIPEEELTFVWEREDGMLMVDATSRTYLPRPGASEERRDGPYAWAYRMNSQGFRENAEIPAAKPAGQYRILSIGDSWMFGITTDQEKNLQAGMEAILSGRAEAPVGGRSVEVINAGVPGASAYDMLVRWRLLGPQFEHDAVLLSVPHNSARQGSAAAQRGMFYEGWQGAPYVPLWTYLGLRRLIVPWTRRDLRLSTAEVHRAVLEDLQVIVREARAAGKAVLVGVWPGHRNEALFNPAPMEYPLWRDNLTAAGAIVTGHRLRSPACYGWMDMGHGSESGYRALAEVLSAALLSGQGAPDLRDQPRCEDVPGHGPGKPDSWPLRLQQGEHLPPEFLPAQLIERR